MKKRVLTIMLMFMMASVMLLSNTISVMAESKNCTAFGRLRIISDPAGADIFIDGTRYEEKVTSCTIAVEPGSHEIELKIPGYEDCKEQVKVFAGSETKIERKLFPELPEATVIYVNTEDDESDLHNTQNEITANNLGNTVSLRRALYAVNNDTSDTSYRIEFADGVDELSIKDHTIEVQKSNLTINGDRDRDGTPDVTFNMGNWGIMFYPCEDLRICGMRFTGDRCFTVRPDDKTSKDVSYRDIYYLGCKFDLGDKPEDEGLIPFCGACKTYNSSGKTNYNNIYCCGCDIGNDNVFFGYCGNCDNSTADGVYYCANKLSDQGGTLTIEGGDSNTWYIYGEGSEFGNGGIAGQFETSDGNTVKNVLISGNHGGGMVIGAGTGGNSRCTVEDLVVRNNYFTDRVHIRPAQVYDEKNVGNTLTTSENVIEDLTFVRNVIDGTVLSQGNEAFIFTTPAALDGWEESSTQIVKDNVVRNLSFVENRYIGEDPLTAENLIQGTGITYELKTGSAICVAYLPPDASPYPGPLECSNNRYEGLSFDGNVKIDSYDPFSIKDAFSHSMVEHKATSASCTKAGNSAYWSCDRCGKSFSDADGTTEIKKDSWVIVKLGHHFSAWKTTKAATEIAVGRQSRTCSVCKKTETKTIKALPPTLKAVKITKLKAGKKSVTVNWKKVSKTNQKKIKKIEIQYSADKKFKKGVKTAYAKKTAASKKITKLASKKTYYVRIRAYKKSGGAVHISKWSNVKSVKVK